MTLLLLGGVVAFEFDNVKSYDPKTKTVTIDNAFGLGDRIATVKLLSDLNQNVFDRGEGVMQKVAEFEIDNAEKYNQALQDMEFFDVKRNLKPINRNFEYRYRITTGNEEIAIHQEDYCNEEKDCVSPIIGYRTHYYYDWIPLEEVKKKDLPQGNIVVGIFVDVKPNEVREWIPTLFGERVEEWAVWTEGLNVGLTHYYTFNESSGTVAIDSAGFNLGNQINITVGNSPYAQFVAEGLIGNSVYIKKTGVQLQNTLKTDGNIGISGTNEYALSIWINRSNPAVDGAMALGSVQSFPPYLNLRGGSSTDCRLSWGGTDSGNVNCYMSYDGTQFDHIVLMRVGSNMELYVNNVKRIDQSVGSLTVTNLLIGESKGLDGATIAEFDEFGTWNRTLTLAEISDLYNSGNGITYQNQFISPPTVTLIAPLSQNFTTSPKSLEFSANASDDVEVSNITLFLNGTANFTQTGTNNNLTFNKTLSLSDGTWTYYYNASDDGGSTAVSITQTIFIDSINPIVSIAYPPSQLEFAKVGDSLGLNFTAQDENLGSCWYNYNGANTTLTCGNNATLTTNAVNFTAIVYANDTLGSLGSDTQTWAFSLLEVNASMYTDNVLEGSTNEFSANISYLSSNFSNIQASLFYNNTEYTSTQSLGTNSIVFSRNVSAVLVTAKNNVSFYWEVRLTNSTGIFPFNLTIGNQTVNNVNIDTCGAFSILFINYSLVDEGTQIPLNATLFNTSIQYALQMYPVGSSNAVVNISGNFSKNNNGQICLENDLGTSTYRIDLATSYGGSLYSNEDYYIQNATISNSSLPQQIVLYDLLTTDTTDFLINFKDTSYLLVDDALIHIQRRYLSQNVFRTVEIQKTDPNGNAIGHFDTDGVVYSILVTKFGEVLGTFTNLAVICQDAIIGDCDLNLKASATINPLDNLEDIGNITYSMVFDSTARTITTNFISTDGSTKTVNISTFKFDRFGNDSVCSQQITSASSTLICTIPSSYGNSTVTSELFVEGNQIVQKVFTIQTDVFAEFGYDMGALTIILMLTLPFMAISSTIGFLVSIGVGLLLASYLMIFSTTTILGVGSSIIWLVMALLILIYKIARRGVL